MLVGNSLILVEIVTCSLGEELDINHRAALQSIHLNHY